MTHCRGPDCRRPVYATELCQAHHRFRLRNPRRKLRPLMTNGEAALTLTVAEVADLLRMAKRQKMTLAELAKKIATVGVR